MVARASCPDAAKVEIQPVHEKDKPRFKLKRVHEAGLFEGVTRAANRVYAYDLVITDHAGTSRRTRDPYSFLPTLGEADLYLFGKGDERRIYDKLGAQLRTIDGVPGTSFAVWAPNAQRVSVVGDFNDWDGRRHPMRSLGRFRASGRFSFPAWAKARIYKFEINNLHGQHRAEDRSVRVLLRSRRPRTPPSSGTTRKFNWTDEAWLKQRRERDAVALADEHLRSAPRFLAKEIRGRIARATASWPSRSSNTCKQMGFTHVEFMPVAEHAFYPSWGYQVTGFYAPTSRFGTPEDFQFLVNALHEAGIGVIIDWVPAHFPRDDWALARFDGTALYEHEDPRKGAHQDWGTLIFNYGRHEVAQFPRRQRAVLVRPLPHRRPARGCRGLDALPRLLAQGGRMDSQPIRRARESGSHRFPAAIQPPRRTRNIPGVMTIAEESTAWPLVTRPPYLGGLGFSFKWNMGWMHDTLGYFKPRSGLSQVSPERSDLRDALSSPREFHPAALAR